MHKETVMNRNSLLITLLSTLAIYGCAQTAKSGGPVLTFEELDNNKNGYITMDEAKQSHDISSNFKQIDTNGDGNVTITEFQVHMGKGRMTPPEEMETPEPGAAPY